MNINLFPFLVLDCCLAVIVLGLIAWRMTVARREDDTIHVLHGGTAHQTSVAAELDKIDKWGKAVTVITVVIGVIVGLAYLYQTWVQGSQIPPGT